MEFKRRMGTGYEYRFRASGRRMSPEQLSAEVLKSLRGDVVRTKGEEISAAVLTVRRRSSSTSARRPNGRRNWPGFARRCCCRNRSRPRSRTVTEDEYPGLLAGFRLRRRHVRRRLIRSEDGTMV